MRVIAGSAGGIRLYAPAGDAVRPTTDRARETLFNVLGDQVQGARCLDLFAGTGGLGIEALSRGAAHCTFVDRHGGALRALRGNLARAHLAAAATVVAAEWSAALGRLARQGAAFDLIFLDPPWDTDLAQRALRRLAREQGLASTALVIVEHRRGGEPLAASPGDTPAQPHWRLLRELKIGESSFSLCRCVQPAEGP